MKENKITVLSFHTASFMAVLMGLSEVKQEYGPIVKPNEKKQYGYF
jgi:hypothetical protein